MIRSFASPVDEDLATHLAATFLCPALEDDIHFWTRTYVRDVDGIGEHRILGCGWFLEG